MNAVALRSSMISSPSGLVGLCWGKTGPPVARTAFLVKHARTVSSVAKTAREATETTSGVKATHRAACSSVLGLGVEWANADPEHLNRRPSVSTKVQELAGTLGFALVDAAAEQLDEVT